MAKAAKATSKKAADDDFVSDDVVSSGSNSYMKFEKGDNEIRIISKPINGWVVWEEDPDDSEAKVPKRCTLEDGEPDAPSKDPMDKPKKFMAVAVIDHADGEVKIAEITQQSIIKAIKALSANPKWGNPFSYDLTITKSGEGKKTRYAVQPSPKKALSKEQVKAAQEKPCYLDALYEGEDPWDVEDKDATEYILNAK